jgi:hypothetical protein
VSECFDGWACALVVGFHARGDEWFDDAADALDEVGRLAALRRSVPN